MDIAIRDPDVWTDKPQRGGPRFHVRPGDWRWLLLWVSEECSPPWMTDTATDNPSGGCRTSEH